LLLPLDRSHRRLSAAGSSASLRQIGALQDVGVSLVIYSTPCLFAAQTAIEKAMQYISMNAGKLATVTGTNGQIGVKDCTSVLSENLARRDEPSERHLLAS